MFKWVGRSHGGSSACVSPRRGHPQRGPAGAGTPAGVTRSFGEGAIGTLWLSWVISTDMFERVCQSPGDNPSVFAIELETLATRAFADVNASARLQLVWDRFIAGQMECSLRRYLDSVGPDTPIRDIVDRCRVWESHAEDMDSWRVCHSTERPQAVYQVVDERTDSKP